MYQTADIEKNYLMKYIFHVLFYMCQVLVGHKKLLSLHTS